MSSPSVVEEPGFIAKRLIAVLKIKLTWNDRQPILCGQRMRRQPPDPPRPRGRSRSPLDSRQEGLLDAHQRNIGTRRGGRQARGRTRGIHRGILQVLKERILRVIASQLPGPRVNILNLRVSQIDQRLAFLKHNWAEDK